MKKIAISLLTAAILALGLPAFAGGLYPLPAGNAYNATHEFIVDFSDFSETSTNTAETVSFSVNAKTAVQFVGLKLETAFDTANTNYTGSLAVTAGDGTDADLFLTSTELASDGTEVWWKFAPVGTISIPGGTNASTATVSALGAKVYTAADTIDHAFTPNEEEATSENTVGQVRFFYNLFE